MNCFRNSVLLVIALLLKAHMAFAGGSSYSQFAFGDLLRYGDTRQYAMAGTGISLVDDGFINLLNPAGMSAIAFTRVSTGYEFSRFSSKDANGTSTSSAAYFQGLAFAVPLSRENGIVLSLQSTPYSSVNYALSRPDTTLGTSLNQEFFGSGGLSFLAIGLSYSASNSLHVGAKVNYLYGRTRQYQNWVFADPDFSNTQYDHSIFYSGFTFTLGAICNGLDTLLGAPSLHGFSLGVVVTTPCALDATEDRITSSIDSTFTTYGTADIPLSFGIGLSYLHNTRYRFLGDFSYENWGAAKFFGSHPATLRNALRGSLGFETLPMRDADTFFKRLVYRAGFAYNSTYYQINGLGINEYVLSGGVGIPIGPESRVNVGVQVALRESANALLPKDTMVRLSVGISASEIWFLKLQEE